MIDELRFNSSTNQLLGFASSSDRDLLAAQLSPVDLTTFQVLERPQEAIEFIYFPESGIASVTAVAKRSEQIPYRTFVQAEGTALRAKTHDLRSALDQSTSLRDLLLRYVQIFLIQTSQTALANATALLPQKIARWLLMSQDRLNTNHIPLTHALLAMMIGVQRSGVTLALGELENHGLITAKRGRITIVDRTALMKMAEGFYGLAEKEYRRRLL